MAQKAMTVMGFIKKEYPYADGTPKWWQGPRCSVTSTPAERGRGGEWWTWILEDYGDKCLRTRDYGPWDFEEEV